MVDAGGEASPDAPDTPPDVPSAATAAVARRAIAGVTIVRSSLTTPVPLDSLVIRAPGPTDRSHPDGMVQADASSMPGNKGEVVDGSATPQP
ncbi:hypothetical protein BY998_101157 [Methylobacterium sp. B4]|nr:hypothetical protein BY998_101157 [Methylobacterium sp. B4]